MADSILQTTSFEGMGIRNLYPKELVSCLYAEDNNNLCALEPSIAGNDVVISYPQNSSGSSNSFKFNESFPFISQMFSQYQWQVSVNAQITAPLGNNATLIVNNAGVSFQTDYPAYNVLQDMRYQVSGTEQQIIYGESMIDYINELVENDDKKNALFELAGKRFMSVSQGVAGSAFATITASAGTTVSAQVQNTLFNQHALHILPWVDPKGHKIGANTKPFPIYRCQNGVEIILRLRNWNPQVQTIAIGNAQVSNSNVQGVLINNSLINQTYANYTSAGAGTLVGNISVGYALNQAYLFFKYHKVANPMMEKKIKMAYPFQTIRNLQTTQIGVGSTPAGTNNPLTIQLNGFAQGQTTNIIFHVVDSSQANDIYSGLPVDNVKLLFNGKVIFQSNTLQDPMWDILEGNRKSVMSKRRFNVAGINEIQNDSNYIAQYTPNVSSVEVIGYAQGGVAGSTWGVVNPAGGTQPDKNMGRQYYYVIPIAETRLSEMHQLGEFSLGGNFSKESLQLQFRVPTATVNSTCTVYISYVYSGIYFISENRECTLSW